MICWRRVGEWKGLEMVSRTGVTQDMHALTISRDSYKGVSERLLLLIGVKSDFALYDRLS